MMFPPASKRPSSASRCSAAPRSGGRYRLGILTGAVEEEGDDFFVPPSTHVDCAMHFGRRLVPVDLARSNPGLVRTTSSRKLDRETLSTQNNRGAMAGIPMPVGCFARFQTHAPDQNRLTSIECSLHHPPALETPNRQAGTGAHSTREPRLCHRSGHCHYVDGASPPSFTSAQHSRSAAGVRRLRRPRQLPPLVRPLTASQPR